METKLIFLLIAIVFGIAWLIFNREPIRAFLIAICFLYVVPTGWIFYHYTGILLIDIPLIAIFLFAFASNRRIKLWFKGISLPVFLFMLWMLVAGFMGMNLGWSLAQLSKWVRAYLVFAALANFARTPREFKTAMWAVLGGFAFEAFLGVYQWRVGTMGLWFLGERLVRAEWWRAHGTFYVPSFFGNYLILVFPFLVRLFLFYRPPKKEETYIYGFLIVLGLGALYATYARGPWLAFIAANGLAFMYSVFKSKLRPKLKWPIFAAILVGIGFTIHYLPVILAQFGEQREQAAMSRIYLAQVAMRLIEDNLTFGSGAACYELLSPKYVVPIKEYPTEHLSEQVHNSYLLIVAENGLPGGILFLWVLFALFRIGWRLIRSNHPLLVNVAIAWTAAMIAISISFLASPDIHAEQILDQVFLLAGLTYAGGLIDNQIKRHKKMMARRKKQGQSQRPPGPIQLPDSGLRA